MYSRIGHTRLGGCPKCVLVTVSPLERDFLHNSVQIAAAKGRPAHARFASRRDYLADLNFRQSSRAISRRRVTSPASDTNRRSVTGVWRHSTCDNRSFEDNAFHRTRKTYTKTNIEMYANVFRSTMLRVLLMLLLRYGNVERRFRYRVLLLLIFYGKLERD